VIEQSNTGERNNLAFGCTIAFFMFLPLLLILGALLYPGEANLVGDQQQPLPEVAQNADPVSAEPQAPANQDNSPLNAEASNWQALTFNAIGPYVNKEAGYVCEGERWLLVGADDDPNGNHLVWQGENGESREFSYRWDGETAHLTDVATGQEISFPMVQAGNGAWMVKGKRLEECAG
jgi:hypothetical protein